MKIDLSLHMTVDNPIFERLKSGNHKSQYFGHIGTHIDTYLKSTIPLEYMNTMGIMFDVSHIQNRDIELSDLDLDKTHDCDFVIFKTDMIKRVPYGTEKYFSNHSQLAQNVVDYLLQQKINFIGIDAAGIRRGAGHVVADKACEEKGIYVIENLTNLDLLLEQKCAKFNITTLWIEFPEQSGLPCRVVVDC